MNRKVKPTKSAQQIKEEQISPALEDFEKGIAEYQKKKKKDRQLAEIKRVLHEAKNSYLHLAKENKQLKQYITYIKQQQ